MAKAPKRPDSQQLGYYYSLAQVGLEMVVPIGLGVLIDQYAGSRPWGVIVGAVLGLVFGFVHLISLLNRRNNTDSNKKERNSR